MLKAMFELDVTSLDLSLIAYGIVTAAWSVGVSVLAVRRGDAAQDETIDRLLDQLSVRLRQFGAEHREQPAE